MKWVNLGLRKLVGIINKVNVSLRRMRLGRFLLCALALAATQNAVAFSGTLNFSGNGDASIGTVVNDGSAGSSDIPGVTIQIFTADLNGSTNINNPWDYYADISADGLNDLDDGVADSNGNGSPKIIIKTQGGEEFSLSSIGILNVTGGHTQLKLEGFKDGVSTGSDIVNLDLNDYYDDFTQGGGLTASKFQNVDEVRITEPTNANVYILLDEIVFAAAVIPPPTITSATYNASTGALVVTGTDFTATGGATNDVIANKFTLTAEGSSTYTLTDTPNVEISSATSFTLTLSATDRIAINQKINKNGTSSTSGTTYNLAGAAGFIAASSAAADLTGNGITASSVAVPTITSATYDASTSTFVVTGTNFLSKSGSSNDIDGTKFSFRGEGGAGSTYIFIDTPSVDLASDTSFTLVLGTADKNAVNLIADKNGTTSVSGSSFLLSGIEDWAAGADSAVTTIDSNNGVTVSNVAVPTITSSTYDVSTGVLVVTGTGFLRRSGTTNDIAANTFTFTGQGGSTYTLTDTPNVEVTSTTSFTLTLSSTDRSGISLLLNKNGTSSIGGTTYNLAAAEDWAAGADSAVTVADLTGNGITASNAPTAPGAPTIGTATAGDTQATVTFTAPSNGGSLITLYTATSNPGGLQGTCAGPAACVITVGSLTNGTAYTFTVTATNSVGTGSASGATTPATPKANQTITFTQPINYNYGATPNLIATADSGLTVSFTSATTGVCTITSGGALAFVSAGTCTIDADQAGNTANNAATTVTRSFTVNAIVPGAPTIGTATAGDQDATVTFTAPASSGGAAITGYVVTANPGGAVGTGGSSPITVPGLTNGVPYTFTVTAANSAGTGAASGASNSVTPASPQTITFNNPNAQNFGTTPTLTASSDSGLTVAFTSATTGVCTITTGGVLAFITAGNCTINANQAGNSGFLAATQVSQTFTVNSVVPGAPTIGVATAGDTQASVAFTAPVSNGGATITAYTVTVSPADVAPVNGSASPIVVTGLTNGVPYTFTVTADNAAGSSPSSSSSNAVTPKAAQAITFSQPGAQNFGTTPTLNATANSGLNPTFSSSTTGVCTITSGGALTFVTAGTCTINADQAGDSSYLVAPQVTRSFTVNAVLPGAPVIGSATAGNRQATVTFAAPVSSGGAAITSYTVTASPGGATASGSGSPITITSLTNGTSYTFTVKATNSAGAGAASSPSNAVTPQASQTISFSNPGDQTVGTSVTLSASATSGLTPTFSSTTPAVCTVSGNQASLVTTGTCAIRAEQSGNGAYSAATPVSQSFTVKAEPNKLPVITQGTETSVTMSEDGAPTPFSLSLSATDGNSDPMTWSIQTAPAHGSANVGITGGTGYVPVANYNGTDSFIVAVTDGKDTVTIKVNVTITAENDAPVISGVPALSVDQDAAYSFAPVASDIDENTTLTYSIANKPSWASFNTATGALTGTPVHADVGTTNGIVISVSDGTASASLAAFDLTVVTTIDPALPVLTKPADITINATGLFTKVTLAQLLGLPATANQAAVDAALAALAKDSKGDACCTTAASGMLPGNLQLLSPGRHEVTWTAKNAAGLTTTGVQVVNVNPLVSLSKSQVAIRGTDVSFRVILNGPSPVYPISIPYVIDPATSATAAEHTLTNGIATFEEGQLEVEIPVTLKPVIGISNSQLVVGLSGDINYGYNSVHVINIRSGNVPPVVTLSLRQGDVGTSIVTPTGGPVTVTANVIDPNTGDSHSFDWSATSGLPDTDGSPVNATRVFSPASLTGSHQVSVTVTDSGGAVVSAQLSFRVVSALPVLSAAADTDKDGLPDALEGTGDSDSNGIPDYLDNMPAPNVLPQTIQQTNSYLVECDPGVRCGLGLLALSGGSGGVQILDAEIGTLANIKADTTFKPVGGVFDFVISDLPTPGQSTRVVLPQQAPIPANAVYRKFHNGTWQNFVSNANNAVQSAPGQAGYCPPPGSSEWKTGLIAGYLCVELTIEDGGPNDDDGKVNSAIADPGAVSSEVKVNPPVEPPVAPETHKKKGGVIDGVWLLLLGGLLIFRRRNQAK